LDFGLGEKEKMEIVTRVNCACSIKARLSEEGALAIEAIGTVEYRPGVSATATVEIPPENVEQVRTALAAALTAAHRRAAGAAVNAANQAREIAIRMEEM